MDELKFVLKTFLATIAVLVVLQFKIDGVTSLESKALNWIEYSSVSLYVNKVAHGAVLAGKNLAGFASDTIHHAFGDNKNSVGDSNQASRLNLEFKRNTQSSGK